jgi:hypothetical protein
MIPVGRHGCFFQLTICLVQQFLGALGVAAKIPFVGLLCGDDAVESLLAKPLRGGQVGVAAADIPVGLTFGHGYAGSDNSGTQKTSGNKVASVHLANLSRQDSRAL